MPSNTQQDIDFQPKTKEFSYSSTSGQNKEKETLSSFFALFLGVPVIIALFLIFLIVLNYFNILSLSALYPNQLGFLPQKTSSNQQEKNRETDAVNPVFFPERNLWLANGTLYSYNNNQIEIKVGEKIVKLEFSSAESMFYKSSTIFDSSSSTSATITRSIPYTLYDLDQKENLGKKVEVYYAQDKSGKNIIQTIKLLD